MKLINMSLKEERGYTIITPYKLLSKFPKSATKFWLSSLSISGRDQGI